MDVISQAALGAACSQALLGKYNKHIPWVAGALAGMAADLDVLLKFTKEHMSYELWHRSVTHSFIFIPVGALIVTLFLMCFPYYRANWKLVFGACLIGYATHGILDACTSFGTLLFWPWSMQRVSWDIISIIDPLFTVPLILGTIWSVIFQQRKGAFIGLFVAGLVLILNTLQHHRALISVTQYAQANQLSLKRIRAIPALASSTKWRIIARNGECFLIADAIIPLAGKSKLIPIRQVPRFLGKATESFSLTEGQQRDLAIYTWFTDDYLIIANTKPLVLIDGRYTWGVDPIIALWGIKLMPQQSQVIKVRRDIIKEQCN
ncbi:MAG TPA: metal-dependent hydrolase [Legionella sp.]|nr:metal-dependent hydrolase [Legionella sp.]